MVSLKGIPNIVSIEDYRVIEADDKNGYDIIIRMELLTPLTDILKERTLSEKETIKLGADICQALHMCGQKNVLHRDIKPQNIFVNEYGDYKLGDFGIAMEKLAGDAVTPMGAPNYIAPEAINGGEYNTGCDLYSLGMVLYQITNANRLPFSENDSQTAVKLRLSGAQIPAPVNASKDLCDVILCAVSFNPNTRFKTPLAMKNALLRVDITACKFEESDLDKTMMVRPSAYTASETVTAPSKAVQYHEEDSYYEDEPIESGKQKKKSKAPLIAVLAVIIIAAIAALAIFALPKLKSDDDTKTESSSGEIDTDTDDEVETAEYSEADQGKIDNAIGNAKQYADEGDYESALKVIASTLEVYPKSKDLLDKKTEYYDYVAENIITDADNLAENEDFESAINLISRTVMAYGDNPKLEAAKAGYTEGFVNIVVAKADGFAKKLDLENVRLTYEEALKVLPEEKEFTERLSEFGNISAYKDIVNTYSGTIDYNMTYGTRGFDLEITSVDDEGKIKGIYSEYPLLNTVVMTANSSLTRIEKDEWFTSFVCEGQIVPGAGDGQARFVIKLTDLLVSDNYNNYVSTAAQGLFGFIIDVKREKVQAAFDDMTAMGFATDVQNGYERYLDAQKTYKGTYKARWGVSNLDVKITGIDPKTGKVSAEFDFSPHAHNQSGARGTRAMTGFVYNELKDGTLVLHLTAGDWIVDANVDTPNFYLYIDKERKTAVYDPYEINLTAK